MLRVQKELASQPEVKAQMLSAMGRTYQRLGESDKAKYRELVRRRAEGSPVAYLVGKKEFYSLSLAVSPAYPADFQVGRVPASRQRWLAAASDFFESQRYAACSTRGAQTVAEASAATRAATRAASRPASRPP